MYGLNFFSRNRKKRKKYQESGVGSIPALKNGIEQIGIVKF